MVDWNLWKVALMQIYLNKIAILIKFDPFEGDNEEILFFKRSEKT